MSNLIFNLCQHRKSISWGKILFLCFTRILLKTLFFLVILCELAVLFRTILVKTGLLLWEMTFALHMTCTVAYVHNFTFLVGQMLRWLSWLNFQLSKTWLTVMNFYTFLKCWHMNYLLIDSCLPYGEHRNHLFFFPTGIAISRICVFQGFPI